MNKQILFASALAVLGLTSCEKELTDDIGDVGSGQVKNSLLQVRTRGSSPGSEATVAYPLQVYVFHMPGGQVPGRPAENKTAELITMKDELGGEYVFNDSFAEYAKVSTGLLLKRFCSVPRTRSTDRP